jgi:septum site-determining protein MinD
MGKIIMIASGKDGVGKSTVTALLGEAFAAKGRSVLLIEFEDGMRSLNNYVGATETLYDLNDVLSGSCDMSDAVTTSGVNEKMKVLFAGHGRKDLDSGQFETLVLAVSDDYDYVLIDTNSSNDTLDAVSKIAMMNLVVSTNSNAGVMDAKYIVDRLYETNAPNVFLIINRVIPAFIHHKASNNLDYCIDSIGTQLIGVILEDEDVLSAVSHGKCLPPNTLAATIFGNIADRIDGGSNPLAVY